MLTADNMFGQHTQPVGVMVKFQQALQCLLEIIPAFIFRRLYADETYIGGFIEFTVRPLRFAQSMGVADFIQNIVPNLKSNAQVFAKLQQVFTC